MARARNPQKPTPADRRIVELRKAITIIRARIYDDVHAPETEELIRAQDSLYAAIALIQEGGPEGCTREFCTRRS